MPPRQPNQDQCQEVVDALQNIIANRLNWSWHFYCIMKSFTAFTNVLVDPDNVEQEESEVSVASDHENEDRYQRTFKYITKASLLEDLKTMFPNAFFTKWPLDLPSTSTPLSMLDYAHMTMYGSNIPMTRETNFMVQQPIAPVLAWAAQYNIGSTPCSDRLHEIFCGQFAAGTPLPGNRSRETALKLLCLKFQPSATERNSTHVRWFLLTGKTLEDNGRNILYPTHAGTAHRLGDHLFGDASDRDDDRLHGKLTAYCWPRNSNNFSRLVTLECAFFLYEQPADPTVFTSPVSSTRRKPSTGSGSTNKKRRRNMTRRTFP